MKKKTKIIITFLVLATIITLGLLGYNKFFSLSSYKYSTNKGQNYELKSFSQSKLIDSGELAQKLNNADLKPGTPMLVSYLKDDLGMAIFISDTLDKPFTKSCTGTDRYAFNVDDYEVCKIVSKGQTSSLMAKVGNNGKYFIVTAVMVYDGKRITEAKDLEYIKEFNNFELLHYQDKLKTIIKSVMPVE